MAIYFNISASLHVLVVQELIVVLLLKTQYDPRSGVFPIGEWNINDIVNRNHHLQIRSVDGLFLERNNIANTNPGLGYQLYFYQACGKGPSQALGATD